MATHSSSVLSSTLLLALAGALVSPACGRQRTEETPTEPKPVLPDPVPTARCGDGVVDPGEECDGAALGGADCATVAGGSTGALGCTSACRYDVAACVGCGNRRVDPGEECDDGDPRDDNDCTTACKRASCGDGLVWSAGNGEEDCDLGKENSDTEPGGCRTDCRLAHCGDGVLDPSEVCEPSAPFNDHCCSASCGWTPANGADPQGVCLAQSGDVVYVCDGHGDCVAVPEEQKEPTKKIDGLPSLLPSVYDPPCGEASCPAAPTERVRALMGFEIRDEGALAEKLRKMYDPAEPSFRRYLTPQEWNAAHAPRSEDFELVAAWIESTGLRVDFKASNRLLFQFSGTVAQFNAAFGTTLLEFSRKAPQAGNEPFLVYGTEGQFTVPRYVAERVVGVITADKPADTSKLPGEAGEVFVTDPRAAFGFGTVGDFRALYGADELYSAGYQGQGTTLGVIVGATFKLKDLKSFWRSMGFCREGAGSTAAERALRCLPGSEGFLREDPEVRNTLEAPATRYVETNLDVEWAGGMAPKARLVVYQGPDSRNTSMVYTWNEAIARGEASVLTDSFAHREDSEPLAVRHQYDRAAMMGAALGITLVAASGDSGQPDTPSSSPYVTAVGGTLLSSWGGMGDVSAWDEVWDGSGSGVSRSFARPYWQEGISAITGDAFNDGKRAVVDLALSATGYPYVVSWKTSWVDCSAYGGFCPGGGTSFASPTFAGLVALINSYRVEQGQPVVGYLNPTLYTDPSVRRTFRDVLYGGTMSYAAGSGWDYPSGWGVPHITDLAHALP